MPKRMKRREFLRASLAASAGAMAMPSLLRAGGGGRRKPNIVFIFIDDMGWRDVGFMGSDYYLTPNIDRLAAEGMVFTSAYTNAANCAPTRACLMSGQYSPRHGVYTVGSSERGNAKYRRLIPTGNNITLPSDVVTIPEALKDAGYVSASMGKWHIGDDPRDQGFDLNIAGTHAGHPTGKLGGYFAPWKYPNITDAPKGQYLTDRLTTEAVKFIRRNRDRPFFLYLTHYAVHTPIRARKELVQKYKDRKPDGRQNNARYAAMIDSVDRSVGRVMAALKQYDLDEDTVVIFYSDNGGFGGVTSMEPLRGAKGMFYEGGIRVPMIVRRPGRIKAGAKCDVPVIGIDFYPTFLELTGAAPPPGQPLDGESIVPLLEGAGEPDREAIYWHFPAYLQGDRRGSRDPLFRTRPCGALRCGDWKLIEYFEDGALELYNLAEDIGEKNNLADKRPDKTKQLHRMMVEWRKKLNAPVPTKKNPKFDPEAMRRAIERRS